MAKVPLPSDFAPKGWKPRATTNRTTVSPKATSILYGQLNTIKRYGTPEQLAHARDVAKGGGEPLWAKGLTGAAFAFGLPMRTVEATLAGAILSRKPDTQNYLEKILDPNYGAGHEIARMAPKANSWAKVGGGLAADLLLDPLTYMTFGASPALKAAGRGKGLATLALDAADLAETTEEAARLTNIAARAGRKAWTLSQDELDELGRLAGHARSGTFSYGVHGTVPFSHETFGSATGAVGGRVGRGIETAGAETSRFLRGTPVGKQLSGNMSKALEWLHSEDPGLVRKGARIITGENRAKKIEAYAVRKMVERRAPLEAASRALKLTGEELDDALRSRPLALREAVEVPVTPAGEAVAEGGEAVVEAAAKPERGALVLTEEGKRVYPSDAGGPAWQEMVARSPEHERLLNEWANLIADRREFAHATAAHGHTRVEFLADSEESGRPYVQRIPHKEFAKEMGVTTRSSNMPNKPAWMEKGGIAPEGAAGEAFKKKYGVDLYTPGEISDAFPEGAPSIEDQVEAGYRAVHGDEAVPWYERDFYKSNEVYERGLAKAIGKYKLSNYLVSKGIAREIPKGSLAEALEMAGPSKWREDLFRGWEDGQMISAQGKKVKNPAYEALQIHIDRNDAVLNPINTQFDIVVDDAADAHEAMMMAEADLADLPLKPLEVDNPHVQRTIASHGEDKAAEALAAEAAELRAEAARIRSGGTRGTLERYAAEIKGTPASSTAKARALRQQIIEVAEGESGTLERYAAAARRGRARTVPGRAEKLAKMRQQIRELGKVEGEEARLAAEELEQMAQERVDAIVDMAKAEYTRTRGPEGISRESKAAQEKLDAYTAAKRLYEERDKVLDESLQQIYHLEAKNHMLRAAMTDWRSADWTTIIKDYESVGKAMHRALGAGWEGFGFARQAPQDVIEVLADINRAYDPVTGHGLDKFVAGYDNLLHWTKGWLTASPGFSVRNAMGGMFNNWLAGVNITKAGREWGSILQRSSPIRAGGAKAAENLAEHERVLFDVADHWGIIGQGQFSAELGSELGKVSYLNPAAGIRGGDKAYFMPYWVKRMNEQAVEPWLRGTLYHDRITKAINLGRFKELGFEDMKSFERVMAGKTDEEIAAVTKAIADSPVADEILADVDKYHFNYDDLSRMERQGVKRIIPFYTWTRKNVPLQVEAMFTQPGKAINRYMTIKRNIEGASPGESVVPSWMQQQGFIRMPWHTPGGQAYSTLDLPFKDPFKVLDFSGQLQGMVNPIIKTPLELKAGKRFFNDVPLTGDYKPMPGSWRNFPGLTQMLEVADLMPFLPLDKARRAEDGTLMMRDKDIYVLGQLLPFMYKAQTLLPFWDSSQEGKPSKEASRYTTTLLSWAFGVASRTNTMQDQESEIYRRVDALDQPVKDMRTLGQVPPTRTRRRRTRGASLESLLASVSPNQGALPAGGEVPAYEA